MADVDDVDSTDPVVIVLADAFRKIPSHRRLYPSDVVPALLAALDAADYQVTRKDVQQDEHLAEVGS